MNSPTLSGKQKRHLRGLAHSLKPVVQVGHAGISEGLIASVDQALLDHELIKVKVLNNNFDPVKGIGEELCAATKAAFVQKVGRIVVLYRPHPEEPVIELPRR